MVKLKNGALTHGFTTDGLSCRGNTCSSALRTQQSKNALKKMFEKQVLFRALVQFF